MFRFLPSRNAGSGRSEERDRYYFPQRRIFFGKFISKGKLRLGLTVAEGSGRNQRRNDAKCLAVD